MKSPKRMRDSELIEKGVELLIRELGHLETARFLALMPKQRVESVKRHRNWQAKLDKDRFFDEVFCAK